MKKLRILVTILIFALLGLFAGDIAFGGLPPGTDIIIGDPSIKVPVEPGKDIFETSRNFGLRILGAAKTLVSGFALIYIVIIGVYMIVFSENEDRIKAQRKQITYVLIAFLFLNIPSLIYIVFFGDVLGEASSKPQIGGPGIPDLWDTTLFGQFMTQMMSFFEVFIFGIAILTFTWGFFRLTVSGGNEEYQKKAKSRILYGVLGLLFFGFVKVWGNVIAQADFFGSFKTLTSKIFGIAIYFAAPVAVGFLILAAYYMITSAGDEERVKKAKSIFLNTFIASLILLGSYSFLSDLASFTL